MKDKLVSFQTMRDAFEKAAQSNKFEGDVDLNEHPLHALYLNSRTQILWKGWKQAYINLGKYKE